jgi:hypothetical protein
MQNSVRQICVLRTKLDEHIYDANGLHLWSKLKVHDLSVVTKLPVQFLTTRCVTNEYHSFHCGLTELPQSDYTCMPLSANSWNPTGDPRLNVHYLLPSKTTGKMSYKI